MFVFSFVDILGVEDFLFYHRCLKVSFDLYHARVLFTNCGVDKGQIAIGSIITRQLLNFCIAFQECVPNL